ncbi:MAG TPA: hypothetical protein V6D00_10300 [Pantanalinema sp.]
MRTRRAAACCGIAIAWILIALGCGNPAPPTAAQSSPTPIAYPYFPERPRGPAIPIGLDVPATPSATPGTWQRIPFVYPLTSDRGTFALYDRATPDILVFPGAGFGLNSITELTTTRYAFDDGRNVYQYDIVTEERTKLVDGMTVGGFAFGPNSDDRNELFFLGTSDPRLAADRIGFLFVTLDYPGSYAGKPMGIGPVNALAALHGGVASFDVDSAGETIVFTTADGGLYLFQPIFQLVQDLLADQEFRQGFAHVVTIDSKWARFVVWEDHRRDSILVLDRWTGLIDAVPEVGVVFNNIQASMPAFKNGDPFNLIFRFTTRDDPPDPRFAVYNLLTGDMALIPILNNALEEPGRTLFSRPGLGESRH